MKLANLVTRLVFFAVSSVFAVGLLANNALAEKEPELQLFDISDQAHIVTWDFKNAKYSYPRRSEELEIDDLFFDRFMVPREDGSYMLTTMPTTGQGLIGFQWYNNRMVSQLYLEFANPERIPPKEKVGLEYWIGQSAFEGQWVPLPGELKKEAKGLRFIVADKGCKAAAEGTLKVRWYFAEAIPSYIFTKVQAFTNLPWQEAELKIEFDGQESSFADVELYNAEILGSNDDKKSCKLNTNRPNLLRVKYCLNGKHYGERSVLSFNIEGYPFGVAVRDVVENGSVYVKDLGVFVTTADSGETLKGYKSQVASKQTILEKVRQMPDQSFSKVMAESHPSCQDSGPAMLSLACDNDKFIIREDCSIRHIRNLEAPPTHRKSERGHRDEFRDDIVEVVPYFGSLEPSNHPHRSWPWFTAKKYPNQQRSLEGSYYPAPLSVIPSDGVVYKQKSFVAPFGDPVSGDVTGYYNTKPLFVSKFIVENTLNEASTASLKFKLILDERTNESPEIKQLNSGFVAVKKGKLLAFVDTGKLKSLSAKLVGNDIVISGNLPSKSSYECVLYMPAWSAEVSDYRTFTDSSRLFENTKKYWDSFLAKGAKIEIPDSQLNNLIKASVINCTITARNECNNTNIAPWVSAAHFGIMESESQSIIEGMSLMGQEKFAQNSLDFFIRRYNADGMLTSGYTLMGLGWHLRVLGQHYDLYSNNDWFESREDRVSDACDWIVKQHEKTKMLTPDGEKVLEYGLMPPGTAADWSYLLYRIRPQAEFYAGLKSAAQALKEVNDPSADFYLDKAEELRSDIIRSYRLTQKRCPVVPISDGSYVPYCPTIATHFSRVVDIIRAMTVKDVSIGAQHLVALGVLEPDAKDGYFKANRFEDFYFLLPHTTFTASKIEKNWFDNGGFYRGQTYYPRITDVYALNDDVKPFIRTYFNNIMPIINTELLTFWEHFGAVGGWNKTHETGWFLQQTRMMLLNERGNDLWLGQFVTNNWMQDGMKVVADDMPTRFGKVSFEITSKISQGYIEAEIDVPDRTKPDSIMIRLRHPEGKKIKSVLVNGKSYRDFDAEKEIVKVSGKTPKNLTVRAYF